MAAMMSNSTHMTMRQAVPYEVGGLLSFSEVAFSSSEVTFSSMAELVATVYSEGGNDLFLSSEEVSRPKGCSHPWLSWLFGSELGWERR
jgi:hypothetical protein